PLVENDHSPPGRPLSEDRRNQRPQQERRVGICLGVERHHLRCASRRCSRHYRKKRCREVHLVETSVACHLPYHRSHPCPWPHCLSLGSPYRFPSGADRP